MAKHAASREDIESGEVYDEGQELIYYVMDLEALIRWFALLFAHEDQEGNRVQNEPIWTVHDEHGQYLPENDRLQRTWKKVMEAPM